MTEYIEREALIEDFKHCGADKGLVDAVVYRINQHPAADVVEVNRGRWMPQILLGQRVWDCSECKTLGSPEWKCCPVCTARMDGKGGADQ